MVQKTCLRVILGIDYDGYADALEMCNLKTLFERREERCMSFAKKCLKHPVLSRLFPLNHNNVGNRYKSREKYAVNFARTKTYVFSCTISPEKAEHPVKYMYMVNNLYCCEW
jgi:hypothetical protein